MNLCCVLNSDDVVQVIIGDCDCGWKLCRSCIRESRNLPSKYYGKGVNSLADRHREFNPNCSHVKNQLDKFYLK